MSLLFGVLPHERYTNARKSLLFRNAPLYPRVIRTLKRQCQTEIPASAWQVVDRVDRVRFHFTTPSAAFSMVGKATLTNVYLLATDTAATRDIQQFLERLGAVAVHDLAWLLPWPYGFAALVRRIREFFHSGGALVIAEITGDY